MARMSFNPTADLSRVKKPPQQRRNALVLPVLLAIVCITIAGVVYSHLAPKWKLHQDETAPSSSGPATTTGCGLRREWRILSQPEKNHYISSIKCLTTIPSKIKPDWTSYEDFPWIHTHVGYYTHNSAPFLPLAPLFPAHLRDDIARAV